MIFIIPSADPAVSQGHLKDMVLHTLPFGVASLVSILEREKLPVSIIDDGITPVSADILLGCVQLEEGRPLFGITCLTLQVARAKDLCLMIKTVVPDAVVIAGGIHASAMPDELLAAGFDFVFSGEADLVIAELCRGLAGGKDVSHLPGLTWQDAAGTVYANPQPALMQLEELPPFPYHRFDSLSAHYDLGAVMSSRGCPYKCIFCSQRAITGATYRTRPVADVLNEIVLLIEKYGIDHITFFDDNFVVNKKWTMELCSGIIERNLQKKAHFMCQLRGDAVTKEMLEILKAAGFNALSFGIETGSERMTGIIQKGESVESNVRAVRLAKEHGFAALGTFILGFPSETAQDRQKTVALALSLPLDVMRVNIAIPYPGTALYNMVKDKITVSGGWKNFNVVSPLLTGPFRKLPLPYIPDDTTEDELRSLMLWTNLRFWLSPRGISSFFLMKSTFVTSLSTRWYLSPAIVWGLSRVGFTIVLNLGWLAFTAVKSLSLRVKRALVGSD